MVIGLSSDLEKRLIETFKLAFSNKYRWFWYLITLFNIGFIAYVLINNAVYEALVCCCSCDFDSLNCFSKGNYFIVERWGEPADCAGLCEAVNMSVRDYYTLKEFNLMVVQQNNLYGYIFNESFGGSIT